MANGVQIPEPPVLEPIADDKGRTTRQFQAWFFLLRSTLSTFLPSLGSANQILGVNAAGTANEYKTLTNGNWINITYTPGVVTFALASIVSPGTNTKITYNANGLVTAGTAAILASADFANQGTTTTVLHGNSSGNPSWGAVSLAADVNGTLPVTNGGTGFASYAVGDILYASSTTALSKLADVAAGSYLRSGGIATAPVWSTTTLPNSATTGDLLYASASNSYSNLAGVATGNALISGGVATAPSWGKIGLTTHVSGTLAEGNGGTNQTTYTTGDMLYASASNTLSKLAVGTSTQVLQGGTIPTWKSTLDISGASGGQISFPATQNASSGANVLDDYEEGTFTPTITSSGGGAPTYTVQVGNYTKIGNRVSFSVRITLNTLGTLAAGGVAIASLPFTTEATANNNHTFPLSMAAAQATAVGAPVGILLNSATSYTCFLYAAGNAAGVTVAMIQAGTVFFSGGVYQA